MNHEKCRDVHSNTDPTAATMRDDFLRDEIFFKSFVTEPRLFFVYSFSLLQMQPYIFYKHTRYPFKNVNEVITCAMENLGRFLPPEMCAKNAKGITFPRNTNERDCRNRKVFLGLPFLFAVTQSEFRFSSFKIFLRIKDLIELRK